MKKSRIVENLFFTLGLFGFALGLIYLISGHEIFEKFLLLIQPIIFRELYFIIGGVVLGLVVVTAFIGLIILCYFIHLASDFALRTFIVFFSIAGILSITYELI